MRISVRAHCRCIHLFPNRAHDASKITCAIYNCISVHFIFGIKFFVFIFCILISFRVCTCHCTFAVFQSRVEGDVSSIDDAHVSLWWINDPVMASSITPRIIPLPCQHHHQHHHRHQHNHHRHHHHHSTATVAGILAWYLILATTHFLSLRYICVFLRTDESYLTL